MHFNCAVFILFLQAFRDIHAFRDITVDGVRHILAANNENITIECQSDQPMTYCGFVHPSGKRFSFSGPSLVDGHCSITRVATPAEAGDWLCHIGTKAVGLEMVLRIHVRVVDMVAALMPNKTVTHGSEATLICATTRKLEPISYCRFEPPLGMPFSIDMAVTADNPILDKYYYPKNMSLYRGDCAVTIKKIKYTDVGMWTCGAGLDDGKEYTDNINVMVKGFYTMSTASVTGLTFGAIGAFLLLAFLGVLVWKKRHMLVGAPPCREDLEMRNVPTPQRSPTTPQKSPRTPQRSPKTSRVVPSLVVESPSEPSVSSPLVTE